MVVQRSSSVVAVFCALRVYGVWDRNLKLALPLFVIQLTPLTVMCVSTTQLQYALTTCSLTSKSQFYYNSVTTDSPSVGKSIKVCAGISRSGPEYVAYVP